MSRKTLDLITGVGAIVLTSISYPLVTMTINHYFPSYKLTSEIAGASALIGTIILTSGYIERTIANSFKPNKTKKDMPYARKRR